jgi:hypothetical protein
MRASIKPTISMNGVNKNSGNAGIFRSLPAKVSVTNLKKNGTIAVASFALIRNISAINTRRFSRG